MRKQGAIQKFLTVLAVVFFWTAGYFAVSVVTCSEAEAQCKCSICVIGSGVAGAINGIHSGLISPGLEEAEAQITASYSAAAEKFTDTFEKKIAEITQHLTDWIDTFWYYNLLPDLQQMTEQLSTMNTDQARALGSFIDAQNVNRANKEFEEQTIASHRELRPGENVCTAGTIAGGMTKASVFTRAYGAAAPAEKVKRTGNEQGSPSATGAAADMNARWQDYIQYYCRKNDNNGASGCEQDGLHPAADIDVTGTIFAHDTIDLTDQDTKKTVDDLITNIAEPFVKDPIPPGAVNSAAGQRQILESQAYKTRRQLIYDALYHIVATRAPGSGMHDYIAPLREEAGIPDNMISQNPSHYEIMKAMMSERFRSGKYGLSQVGEPENSQRELVIQQAFQLMQMSDQLDLMDRYALVLAGQASEEIKQMKPRGSASGAVPLSGGAAP